MVWLGTSTSRLFNKSVFGVPELHREEIKKAQLVSCPGCMAVTSMLALAH